MRIVSLNAWGGKLWEALSHWLPGGADILLLQEVTRAPEPSPDWLEYVDAERRLDQRADLFGDIAARLPGWQAVFAAAARGEMTDGAGRTFPSEHGIAAFFAPHLAVTEQATGFVHGRYRAGGWGPEPVPRTMQCFRVVAPGGPARTVAHFHGLRDPAGKGDTPARAAQADRAAAYLRSFAEPDEGIVLAGDFNILPDSTSFAIWAQLGLRDLVIGSGISDTRTSHYPKSQRHANYMLVNPFVTVAAFDAPSMPEISDHRPLVLDLED
ncbi:MAG: endonuclease/exonuclease/phosphatase family protein [Pseudomonadota bacterium]